MQQRIVLSAIAGTLFGTATVLPQGLPSHPTTFFVASAGPGAKTFLGLVGADELCQTVAQAAGVGDRTWHARLSANVRSSDVNLRGADAGRFYCFTIT